MLTLTPGVDFDLDFVNTRIRDGTVFFVKHVKKQFKKTYACFYHMASGYEVSYSAKSPLLDNF